MLFYKGIPGYIKTYPFFNRPILANKRRKPLFFYRGAEAPGFPARVPNLPGPNLSGLTIKEKNDYLFDLLLRSHSMLAKALWLWTLSNDSTSM